MPLSPTSFLHRMTALLTGLMLLLSAPLSHATIDDAHSFAMEAAVPFVEQGFIVREDYWNGEVKSGQKLMVRHQMFKGNEYAFWLGTAQDDVTFELQVLDETGKEIELDFKSQGMFATVRVNPPKTGTYSVVFSLTSKKEKGVYWALAYGYR
ncbi:hypothetical protein EI77_02899 [Prosthecobacter fusiformis]|uniref:Uncharacterized protein n=2 Tax=Prosthecobacter fusiformis TaxID=48464 RepID=A0A4R7RUC3_9BACT|nr:hypothetical protein EI77_02899 [Prosthecobacter fusiformis]